MSLTASNLDLLAKCGLVVFGIIALITVILLFAKRKSITGKKSKVVNIVYSIISVVLAGVIVASNIVTSIYEGSINSVFTQAASGDSSVTSTEEDWKGLVTDIADEGMVLLKNENDALPLASGEKINLLGYNAYNPYYSGSGSGKKKYFFVDWCLV